MTTMTIEFPEVLAHHIEDHGISQEQLQVAILQFVRLYVGEQEKQPAKEHSRLSGAEFAKRIIDNNRELFEELARL